jgi:hypothetical protein
LEARGKHQLQTGYKINIYGGAWKLGASGVTDDAEQGFRLSGGTLEAADGTANSCGPLAITARGGKIKLGEGATLTFADSSAETWAAASRTVTVEGFAEGAIRFGTSGASAPKKKLFVNETGNRLYVTDDGYITAIAPGLSIIVR